MTYEQFKLETAPFAAGMKEKFLRKMPTALEKARDLDFIPYTVNGREWAPGPSGDIFWWTNGFWPGVMWLMYLISGNTQYRTEAEHAENMLDEALRGFEHLHHDVGFMWYLSSGVNYRLTGNEKSLRRTRLAAEFLMARFNPLGFIRAWNEDKAGWAIIDTMMNLNLLYWASEYTGDPRYRLTAMRHADTVMKYFIREDGSSEHIVIFDPESMKVLDKPRGQGYAKGSSWSRGQAWALYGFVLSYIHTGKAEYLETAGRIANYFIDCVKDDWLPKCDFRQPEGEKLLDNCSGAIAACGMIELARQMGSGDVYFPAAIQLLKALDESCANWDPAYPAILTQCSGAYHSNTNHHIAMIYGDFFLIEAVGKLLGTPLLIW